MRLGQNSGERLDRVVLLFLFGMLLFFSPFTFWWAATTRVWYLPYVLWLGLVVLIAWVVHPRHDDV
jgi:hypothetical protein